MLRRLVGLPDNEWRSFVDPWRLQKDRPWEHSQIEIWRAGWDKPEITTSSSMHPMMNAEGLYWRPHKNV